VAPSTLSANRFDVGDVSTFVVRCSVVAALGEMTEMRVALVARPRLVELMSARWQQRAVCVVGGPGFGKSVLVAQAIQENMLAPRGTDVLVTCSSSQCSAQWLLHRIAQLADVEICAGISLTVPWLLTELDERWPHGVCIIIDDVHHITHQPVNKADHDVIGELVKLAPPSVHFVLVSRERIAHLAQLRADGEVIDIGANQLLLSSHEVQALADLHDVSPTVLASTGGWPAAASMVGAFGLTGAEEYVFETVLHHLEEVEIEVLAVALAIGVSDGDLLHSALGEDRVDPKALLARLPMVSVNTEGEYCVHDLWQGVIAAVVDHDRLNAAIRRASDALVARAQFDRAFHLCAEQGDWERAAGVLTSCCRFGHVEVAPAIAAQWLEMLPRERWNEPEGLLLRGLIGRVTDPFAESTAELLEAAVHAYRNEGNVAGEIAAGVELVYVLRNQGRCEQLPVFLARAVELCEAGHIEATGPAAVGRALFAELSGDDRQMIDQLDAIDPTLLSRDWQAVVTYRQTIAHLTLGNETEMMYSAQRCAHFAGNSNDRHVLTLAQWFAGQPSPALDGITDIIDDADTSCVDAVVLRTMATMVLATAGRVDEAGHQLTLLQQAASGPTSVLMNGALIGAQALLCAARGDDEQARITLEQATSDPSFVEPIGWRMAARWLPLAYVLVPSTRDELDQRDVGPLHRRRLEVARAVVAARESAMPIATTVNAPLNFTAFDVASTVPLPWAMELVSRWTADGVAQGRAICECLLELYGNQAKEALRSTALHQSATIAAGARKLLAAVTVAPDYEVRLCVLGPLTLTFDDSTEINAHWNRERVRSLLLFLVVNGPSRREAIAEALWPHLDLGAADRNLRVTLTYLHQVLEPDRCQGEASFFVRQQGSTLMLVDHPSLHSDLHEFRQLVDEAEQCDRRGLPSVALRHYEQALRLWRGPCLHEVAYEQWAQEVCREVTMRYVEVALRAAELHLASGCLVWAVECARRALVANQWSEPAYRVLIAAALSRGDRCGAQRLLDLCDAMLVDLGTGADPQTELLRRRLTRRPVERSSAALALTPR
jgi:LuxR family transcriptional regulator, maltose regulon positive regulatory protein